MARQMKTAGLAAAGAFLIMGGAATSLVTASASTHFYDSTTTQTPTPISGFVPATLSDSVHLTGHNPTGDPNPKKDAKKSKPTGVVFSLFGPNSPGCSGDPVFTSGLVMVDMHHNAKSGSFVANDAGVYHWFAHYTGDSDNHPSDSGCAAVTITTGGVSAVTGVGSGVQAASVGTPATGRMDSGLQSFFAVPGAPATGVAGIVAGALMLLAGPPMLLLARRFSSHSS